MIGRSANPSSGQPVSGRLVVAESAWTSLGNSWRTMPSRFIRSWSIDRNTGAGARHPPQHFLNFLPLPQGHGSLRPTLGGAL